MSVQLRVFPFAFSVTLSKPFHIFGFRLFTAFNCFPTKQWNKIIFKFPSGSKNFVLEVVSGEQKKTPGILGYWYLQWLLSELLWRAF